jgi:hypothetical protein
MYIDHYQVSPESTRTVNRNALATMLDNCAARYDDYYCGWSNVQVVLFVLFVRVSVS